MDEILAITEVGKANEVILGIAAVGADLDGCWIPDGFPFADDNQTPADAVSGN
jgi:hypothetical protein